MSAGAQRSREGSVSSIDHVALPMQHTDEMVAFYRALGCEVVEHRAVVSVHAGEQMINFHRPELWPRAEFTLRAPNATPPCGDLCFVWDGSAEALADRLEAVGTEVIEGPVTRRGGRQRDGTSTYVRDPDGNLLELIIYDE